MNMKKAVLVTRTLYGLLLVVFGSDAWRPYLPGHEVAPAGAAFLAALAASGYLLPLVHVIVVGAGLCLLAGYLGPLALALLAPVVVNIALFHLVLDPAGLPLATVFVALQLFLMWGYRDYFEELFQVKPQVF